VQDSSLVPKRADGRSLRVAVDATPLYAVRAGVHVFCAEVLAALANRGELDVSAFAVTWRLRRQLLDMVPSGVRAAQTPMPARPINRLWTLADFPPIEWFIGPFDVVHGTNFIVPPTRRAAQVVTVHDLTPVHHPELSDDYTRGFPHMVRRALKAGAWVHTHSQFVADEVVEAFGADPQRVRAIHPGIPGRQLPVESWHPPLPDGTDRYILAVGTIEPRKDYPGLVAAYDRVTAEDVALLILGADGWGVEAFDRAVRSSPKSERIMRLGFVDDEARDRTMAAAAVLAFPSVYEGFGFPPLEAMRLGVPVVATAVGSVPEVVGDAALLVEPRDPEALADALDRVLEDGSLREDLIQRGRGRATGFTWAATAEGLSGLYHDAARE
jgi:glycosyltransferase involved in cell wall biosynthesis